MGEFADMLIGQDIEEMFAGRYDEDYFSNSYEPPPPKTCRYCKTGDLEWVYAGKSGWRLAEHDGTLHVCKAPPASLAFPFLKPNN